MNNNKHFTPSRIAALALYLAVWIIPHLLTQHVECSWWMWRSDLHLLWFAIPVFVIWNAERLAGRIRFLTLYRRTNEPAWAVHVLGWLVFVIQILTCLAIPGLAHIIYGMD
jgi:hypothetical protein